VNIDLTIVDTAGMEKYRSMSGSSVRNADIVLLTFGLDDAESFKAITEWADFARSNNPDCKFILLANKSDGKRVVSTDDIVQLAVKLNVLKYAECSAKTGLGFGKVFDFEWKVSDRVSSTVTVQAGKEKKGCCE